MKEIEVGGVVELALILLGLMGKIAFFGPALFCAWMSYKQDKDGQKEAANAWTWAAILIGGVTLGGFWGYYSR